MTLHRSAKDNSCLTINPDLRLDSHRIYTEGDVLYSDMLHDIDAAKQSVFLESYIFADDNVGRSFIRKLKSAAEKGIDVRLHIDAAGSRFALSSDVEGNLIEHGVKIKYFHRWSCASPLRYNQRNHRKLLIIDNKTTYLAGFNIHEENSYHYYGAKRWRVTHLRLSHENGRGPNDLFLSFWQSLHTNVVNYEDQQGIIVTNINKQCKKTLHCTIQALLNQADKYIYLTTPYFSPDRRTQASLVNAVQRGVKVVLLLPHKSDVLLTKWAAQASYQHLLNQGIEIFEYQRRVLHAKVIVTDKVSLLGSANIDYRSFFQNYEVYFMSTCSTFKEELTGCFVNDIATAKKITIAEWTNRMPTERIFELVGWAARKWL